MSSPCMNFMLNLNKSFYICDFLCWIIFISLLQPNLLSAHRIFIRKLNVLEVGEELRGKGTTITLFVFTDSLEVGFSLYMILSRILYEHLFVV